MSLTDEQKTQRYEYETQANMGTAESRFKNDPYNFFSSGRMQDIANWYFSTLTEEQQNQENYDYIMQILEETGGPNIALDQQKVDDLQEVLERTNRSIQSEVEKQYSVSGKGLKGGRETRFRKSLVDDAMKAAEDAQSTYRSSWYGLEGNEVSEATDWFATMIAPNLLTTSQIDEKTQDEQPWYLKGTEYSTGEELYKDIGKGGIVNAAGDWFKNKWKRFGPQ